MNMILYLAFAILLANLLHLIRKDYRNEKHTNDIKKRCKENITTLEQLMNEQVIKSKVFEDRLDMFQVSLSKAIFDVRDVQSELIKSIPKHPLELHDISDMSFEIGLVRLKKNKSNTSKKEEVKEPKKEITKGSGKKHLSHKKTMITKQMILDELEELKGMNWKAYKDLVGEKKFKTEYTKSYNRLYYKHVFLKKEKV